MKREDEEIWKEAEEAAKSICAKWNLKTMRDVFIAEYAERRWLEEECNRLNMLVRSLCGRIGVLKRQKGGGK